MVEPSSATWANDWQNFRPLLCYSPAEWWGGGGGGGLKTAEGSLEFPLYKLFIDVTENIRFFCLAPTPMQAFLASPSWPTLPNQTWPT